MLEGQKHGQPDRTAQQNARVERRHAIVRSEFSRARDAGVREEFSNRARQRHGLRRHAVRQGRRGRFHDGLSVSDVRVAGFRDSAQQFRR